jgi:peptidoglycan/xylan/chitin deacetylase (PgdA/CDA1 family)
MSYRQKISRALARSGMLNALEQLPAGPGLIVFNHHRIGNRAECAYDRGLFSASAEQFDYQLSYIKRHFPVLLPHELAEFMSQKKQLTRLHAMITFDDGYLDNYTLAFQLLKRHNMAGVFFLVSTFVGTAFVPWWDEIAYLVRHSPASSLPMMSRRGISIDLNLDREDAVDKVLQAYKSEENADPTSFLRELREEAQVTLPDEGRRFLNWEEAREMRDAGMEIGAHTHTHPFLSRLSFASQQAELRESKAILDRNMGQPVTSLAYPNGTTKDFTTDTQQIAREAGYTTAFSYYGGINRDILASNPYDIFRGSPNSHQESFRVDTVLATRLEKLEPAIKSLYRRVRA